MGRTPPKPGFFFFPAEVGAPGCCHATDPRGLSALKVLGGPDMEKDEGIRAGGAEPLRGRDKILCYINMQSPGRSCTAPSPADALPVRF